MRLGAAALTAAALVLFVGAAANAHAADDAPAIVFASNRAPNQFAPKLYVLPVGGRKHLLTPAHFEDRDAAWWPGDRAIVVSRVQESFEPHAPGHLVLVDARNGRLLRALTRGAGESCPAPSPDGRWIAYCAARAGDDRLRGEIWVARSDGSHARLVRGTFGASSPLVNDQPPGGELRWSPDSHAFATTIHTPTQGDVPAESLIVSPTGRVLHRMAGSVDAWLSPQRLAVSVPIRGGADTATWIVTPAGKRLARLRGAAERAVLSRDSARPHSDEHLCGPSDGQLMLCGHGAGRPLVPLESADVTYYIATAWAPDGQRLLYSDWVDACFADLYATVAGSSALRRLTNGPYDEVEPTVSPDGTLLAYTLRVPHEAPHVLVKRLAGGRARDLGIGWSPSWSPDGRDLAATSTRSIVVLSANGGARRLVARGHFRSVDWSPDGTTLVTALGSELGTLPASGGTFARLGVQGEEPAWSPDGKLIAYSATGIWVMGRDGTGKRELTTLHEDPNDGLNTDTQPSWAPDGGSIAFASGVSLLDFVTTGVHGDAVEPQPYDLWTVRLDGSAPSRVLDESRATDFDPTWVP